MKRKGCSIIFFNHNKEVLLFLRDDIPEIPYPNMWDLPGGHVESDETPEECIVREMNEEINYHLENFSLFKIYDFDDREEHVFLKCENFEISDMVLYEGQCLKWFDRKMSSQTQLACGFNKVLNDFFNEVDFT